MRGMRTPHILLLAIALTLIASIARAGSVTLSYTPPTTCADGTSPLTDCPTTGFEISEATTVNGTYTVRETVGPTGTTRTYQGVSPGTRCYFVKTVSNDQKSAESTRACTTVPFLPPKAPQGITVKVEITVATP